MSRQLQANPRSGTFSRLARMPRLPRSMLAFGLSAAAAVTLVACGSEDAKLLPGETAREITANLDTVKQLTDEGDCLGAESAAGQVSEQIEALGEVDRRLKQALRDGVARLNEVIAECEESSEEAIAPAQIPAETESEEEKPSKAEKAEQKEREKEAKEEEAPPTGPKETKGSPELPPQAKGEGKGLENGNGPAEEAGGEEGSVEAPSGGVSPGSPAGEGD
jgi:hypothetical protein